LSVRPELEAFGDVLCDSEGVLVSRRGAETTPAMAQMRARLQGVVFAQQYMMLDYDCPKELLEKASAITPGIESPTVSPMADPAWVAVRSMVPRKRVNAIMDELAAAGAKAIIATDIRSCRMGG
jgi:ATP phosphoribosyltransferase